MSLGVFYIFFRMLAIDKENKEARLFMGILFISLQMIRDLPGFADGR